jgi:hypothetical protein
MKKSPEQSVVQRIPSSLYPDVVEVINSLSQRANYGHIGFVALLDVNITSPVVIVVSQEAVEVPGLSTASLTVLDPREVRSMPLIEEVLHNGIRLLGQTEQLAATVERLADKIELASREAELKADITPIAEMSITPSVEATEPVQKIRSM